MSVEQVSTEQVSVEQVSTEQVSTEQVKVPKEVQTLKQYIIYYICNKDVRASFGKKLYLNIYNSHFIKKEDISRTLIYVKNKKKSSIEYALKLPNDYSISSFKKEQTPGIGVNGITFILTKFEHN